MNISYILCLFLAVFSSACDDDKTDENNAKQVTVTISHSDKVIVEGEGGDISFTVTPSDPAVELRYVSSVEWMKAAAGGGASWSVAANSSELSREGRIYILNKASLARLDTINVIQKSVNGEIQEHPTVSFTEADVPVSVPFAGNSYVTYPKGSTYIDNYTGKFKATWADETIVSSTYFYVGEAGDLNLAAVGSNETGNSVVRFKVQDKVYNITISGPTSKIYGIATIPVEKPGYIRVDMQGVSKSGKSFGDITGYRIGGQAALGTNHFVTEEKMNEGDKNCYFYRRGSSVHWFYTQPTGNAEYFYNEVLVTPENALNSTYYMMNGFSEGYMGIQQTTSGEHKVLFSVWSPYTTDDPEDIPDEKRVKVLRKGANVTIGEFGNEGSGGQSWLHYNWTAGTVYKALVRVKPDGNGSTVYTGYFYADGEWKLIASFSRPETNTWYKGAYSFLENFDPINSIYPRSVLYKNQWMRLASGEWKEITGAKFSCDDTGRSGLRYDYSGSVDQANGGFVLKSFGFTDDHTDYGTMFTRSSGGTAPDIDLDALENIPSVE